MDKHDFEHHGFLNYEEFKKIFLDNEGDNGLGATK
jgi:hypothetical protein